MKQKNNQGFYLSLLFIVLIYLFTRSYYSPFFLILLGLFLYLAFLKEENRLFAWVMISFFGGNMILVYLDKFIQGIQVDPFLNVIIYQLLFIIPILLICYVIRKFNKKISLFLKKTELIKRIQLPFAVNTIYLSIIIIGIISVLLLLMLITMDVRMDVSHILSLFLFALIHALLQEVIWRGILLTQMIKITNETYAILFTSIAFAFNTTIFGFSVALILLYLVLGILFGFLTTKYKSVLPAILAHTFVLILFFFMGLLQLPI
ncbi:CPBP family intramembrane glutamic endopeptidase [Neobacillus niacini]|uniref:CPBP family intramembrane glutamic endopeptidase n=1 Tax=Neobacillus niacini TaxID=86668 RepID=UPI002FFFACCA